MNRLFRFIPKGIGYLIGNFIILYALAFSFRLIFYLFFMQTAVEDTAVVMRAWYLGAKFDLRLILILLMPIFLLVVIFKNRIFRKKIFRKIIGIYFFVIELSLIILYVADLGNYEYLGRRLDATILRFLNWQDAGVNATMVWESYPVLRGLLGMIIVMVMLSLLHRWLYKRYAERQRPQLRKWRFALPAIITFILIAGGIYGNFSYYPLRWSQAMFSGDNGITSLALNPVLHFVNNLKFREASFDLEATRKYYPVISDYLGVPHPDSLNLNFVRSFPGDLARPKANIVFVMLESTGAAVSSMYSNPVMPTPNMQKLADSGVLFKNFYVPAHSTARTVYALTTGLPDITENKTASRHPKMIDQRVIMNEFKGYEKYYLLGGNMNWANIRALFTNNVKGVKLFEESYFNASKADVWGISDYDLVRAADRIFDRAAKRKQPFVAFLQLADNHKPYTTTAGAGDFKRLTEKDLDMDKFKRSGFQSIDQLNALRYEDYNVGQLIHLARQSGYLDNTIFVFFGDHNCALNPYQFMPIPEYEMGTGNVHVTSFIYSPRYFKPQQITEPASLLDLFPTFAHFVGIPFKNYTLGRNIFDSTGKERYAFIWYRKNSRLHYGLMGSRFLYEIREENGATGLYKLDKDPLKNVEKVYPDTADYMDKLLHGFVESTWYLMFNNKKQ